MDTPNTDILVRRGIGAFKLKLPLAMENELDELGVKEVHLSTGALAVYNDMRPVKGNAGEPGFSQETRGSRESLRRLNRIVT